MTVKVKLSSVAEDKLSEFATSLLKQPSVLLKHSGDVLSLRTTLDERMPLDVRNQLVEQMNRDPDGTIKKAQAMIDKDPSILAEFNKDPMKLASAMGVKPAVAPAPAAAQPVAVAQTSQSPKPDVVTAAPAVAKPPEASKPLTAAQLEIERKTLEVHAEIRGMPGYKELMDRAAKDPSLDRALTAIRGDGGSTPEDSLKSLTKFRDQAKADPEFFIKANKTIDDIPPQMRDNVFSQIAENPALGKQALAGDGGAKMQLMLGGMFGGGGKGLSGLFGGAEGGGIMQMLGNLLPKLLEGLKQALGPIMNGIGKMMGSSGLMGGMGNGQGQVINNTAKTIDQTMGSNIQDKPYVDASRPDQPATTLAQKAAEPAPDARPGAAEPVVGMVDQRRLPGTQAPNTAFV